MWDSSGTLTLMSQCKGGGCEGPLSGKQQTELPLKEGLSDANSKMSKSPKEYFLVKVYILKCGSERAWFSHTIAIYSFIYYTELN